MATAATRLQPLAGQTGQGRRMVRHRWGGPSLLLAAAIWACCWGPRPAVGVPRKLPPIFVPAGRPLRIMMVTDIHYGEFPGEFQGILQDGMSTGATQTLLELEKPDFVVVLGDLVTGEDFKAQNNNLGYVRQMLAPILMKRLPFASTYGNHDLSRSLPRATIFRYDQSMPRSYTQQQTPATVAGITNYVLPIRSRAPGAPVVAQLVFLDSGGVTGLGQPQGGMNWVTDKQVAFLKRALLNRVATYVFVHIPPPQFQTLQNNFAENQCVGLNAEPNIGVQAQDQGLWAALLASNQVMGVFSGHNHGSGWCCKASRGAGRRPLAACFARHTGFGGYGDWPRAARMLTIGPGKRFKLTTWVRDVQGNVGDGFTV